MWDELNESSEGETGVHQDRQVQWREDSIWSRFQLFVGWAMPTWTSRMSPKLRRPKAEVESKNPQREPPCDREFTSITWTTHIERL